MALGVVDMRDKPKVFFNTQEAAQFALNAALDAAARGSTGVGGVLLGPHKELIALSCNRVYADGKLVDPTAHGERQLVDWYFDKVKTDSTLPPPEQCTIVTSLDPCLMCTGSILTGGFNVISSSLDTAGGVNWDGKNTFADLPEEVRQDAREHFSYFAVEGKSPYQGPAVYGEKPEISEELSTRSVNAFLDSIAKPKPGSNGAAPGPVSDLKGCSEAGVMAVLKKYCPQAMTIQSNPDQPGPELAETLLSAARQSQASGGKFNAAALIDPHGNLVMVRGSKEHKSPLRTPFMELTRAWAKVRAEAGPEGARYLAPIKDCTLVTLLGPAPDGPSVMEFGAYGSSVKGKARQDVPSWQFVIPRQSQEKLDATIDALPPHYSQKIHPRIAQVTDQRLIEACQSS